MDKKIKVLIFPAGEINSVELHDALASNVNIEVYGASSVDRHGPYIFRNYMSGLPYICDPTFLDALNELIVKWEIDYIFPTHDSVALFMAENRIKLKADVIASDAETAQICRDKRAIYGLFKKEVFCPHIYSGFTHFPCFIKPRKGQGAVGAMLVESVENIPANVTLADYVVTEYLPGEELTVDCFTDGIGNLRAILPRTRKRLLAGISVAGETIPTCQEIQKIAETINRKLKFFGLWYFQLKQDGNRQYKLLEVSTRCAGAMCLSRARGINLPLLSIYAASGQEVEVFENSYSVQMDRTLISRYQIDYEYQTVYVDYDDTIVFREEVCPAVIRFLYQCRNQNKKIVLLTKHSLSHKDTVLESLKLYAISPDIFDEIVELSDAEEKSDFIRNADGAVFIDNAYFERKKVHEKIGIPVFDVEGVEVLLDWRS